MNYDISNKKEEGLQKVERKPFVWRIPDCCSKGLPSCKHVVNRENKKQKTNVGL